jgi:hypothetical protein
MTDEEIRQIDLRFEKIKEDGTKNILKYFDRIHDKLFAFNNVLIAGYFALAKIEKTISVYNIIIPLSNLAFLLFIEYRMMETSRFESRIMDQSSETIAKYVKKSNRTNLYSFSTILSTLIVTLIFLFRIWK